ncbi:Nif11-like leader peptide family natural product precursor [Cylindrospermum sp. FACHB-282]|uniref:Nif11-like leader peptide family natural product precursor n=1 Tax=Cylindrospermum sp. FACHB-282 TaxID=2692794 RepID=UPI001687F3FE|nr:Nif11-like leader peptide family natural product precursor [Cylindrospermum sp. FACHB-282]MBD2383911.1 Nif11 family protein [Cylindrospermum sp. FACHB-282]
MSKEAVLQFYQFVLNSPALKDNFSAITGLPELIKLGAKYNYIFNQEDIAEASAIYAQKSSETEDKNGQIGLFKKTDADFSEKHSQFYHYEFKFSDVSGFEEIDQEIEKLKIKPSTVDMELYEKSFRDEDFNFASISPDSPEFKQQYDEIMKPCFDSKISLPEHEYTQRQFHLINLDLHVDHLLYEDYLMTKVRLVKLLEKLFGFEIKFSGSLWYPPNAYRLWHTNENQPGWRMYLIDFDEFESNSESQAFFRYMNPQTKELVTIEDKPKLIRFFKVEQEEDKLFWHCIVNATKFNRWSFGFLVSDDWMDNFLLRNSNKK